VPSNGLYLCSVVQQFGPKGKGASVGQQFRLRNRFEGNELFGRKSFLLANAVKSSVGFVFVW
jgi:hypothetical protein